MAEARRHPHNVARGMFTTIDGAPQPAPAPRFSRTPGAIANPPRPAGADTVAAFTGWGFPTDEVDALLAEGVIARAPTS